MNPPPIPTSASRGSQPPPPLPCRSSNSNELSQTTVKATNIESLPDELLFDILACLPSEFLHDISRLVCRKWRRITHSDAFANRQIQHSAYGLLLSSHYINNISCAPPRHSIDAAATQGPFETTYDLSDKDRTTIIGFSIYATATQGRIETTYDLSDKGSTTTIIGCCNGLALELHHNYVNGETLNSLHVMNPLTKKSFLLPSFSFQNTTCFYEQGCGIGYSAASMKYKVILPYKRFEGDHVFIGLAILTVGVDKSWRHVELPGLLGDLRGLRVCPPLTSEGSLHWEWGRCGDCLTLNVETEIFTTTAIPNINLHNRSDSYYIYLSTGRYLSLLVGCAGEFCWDIWVIQSGEWRKLEYKIDLEAQKEKLQQFATGYNYKDFFPVGWVKYPKILVFGVAGTGLKWRHCIFYNLETHEIKTIDLPEGYNAFAHRKNLLHMV